MRSQLTLLLLVLVTISPGTVAIADQATLQSSKHGGTRPTDWMDGVVGRAQSNIPRYANDLGPYYNPNLPAKKYFDKEQEKLAQTLSPDVSAYIYFVDAKDCGKKELAYGTHGGKSWTLEEKNDVIRIFSTLYGIAPGLIVRAASGHKLGLYRATTLDGLTEERRPAASSSVKTINFADSFFHTPYQLYGLVHELVHESDWNGQIAYSKDWVDFAAPRIYKHKIESGLMTEAEQRRLEHSLRSNEDWPSLYGCQNLKEALAEYCASAIVDGFTTDPIFSKELAPKILTPLPQEIERLALFKEGRANFLSAKYGDAVTVLEQCTAVGPSVAQAHVELAACQAEQGHYKEALREIDIAEQLMDKVGVRSSEPDMLYLLRWKATMCHRRGDDAVAIAEMNKVLLGQPPLKDDFYRRFWMEDKGGLFADAALDLYRWKELVANCEYLPAGELDIQFSQSLLDKDVERFPKVGIVLRRRARFLESLANMESNDDIKTAFHLKALADFQRSLGLTDCDEVAGLFECGVVSCKLKDYKKAREYLHKLGENDKEWLAPAVLEVIILCGEGKTTDAQVIYDKLRSRIFQMAPPHHNDADSTNGLT